MKRTFLAISTAWVVLAIASDATAANWAKRLFEKTSHDFGVVARASKTEYSFEFTNTLDDELHVAYVRSSCGCTKLRVQQRTVKSGETGAVVARYNTWSFTGRRGATLTVVFDRPRYAEVQLHVTGYIRRDVVFDPGKIDFGSVDQGQPAERIVKLEYAGRRDWRILNAQSPLPHLSLETKETHRAGGRVGYELIARLSDHAPTGYLTTELTLQTNDRRLKSVPLMVTGRVSPALSVSPALLFLGNVPASSQCTKRLVVRGPEPFRIIRVECEDLRFQFGMTDEAKTLHFVPVVFNADDFPGEVSQTIRVHTDLAGGKQAEAKASATIVFPVTGITRQ
jgi:hypothetical protein